MLFKKVKEVCHWGAGGVRGGYATHSWLEARHPGEDWREIWQWCLPEDDAQSKTAWPTKQRGPDHMKPPELSNLKTELVAKMAAAAEASSSSPTRVPISILPWLHLNKVHYLLSISAPIFRCQCFSKSNTPCTNRKLRSRLPPRLLPRNKHPALIGELLTLFSCLIHVVVILRVYRLLSTGY